MVTCVSSAWKMCFIYISHVNTNLKVILAVMAGCSLKQQSTHVIFLIPFMKE